MSWSTSTVTAWQALENMYCGALYRLETSMPSSASGGSTPGLMPAAAIWASVTLLPSGSPLIRAVLPVISRSPGSISSSCPATASTRSRMAAPASCAAPPATPAVLLPPVIGPYGVASESPWKKWTSSKLTPISSATIWDMVVAMLCPWLPVPM